MMTIKQTSFAIVCNIEVNFPCGKIAIKSPVNNVVPIMSSK